MRSTTIIPIPLALALLAATSVTGLAADEPAPTAGPPDYGPLAVVDDEGSLDTVSGTLVISDACVEIQTPDGSTITLAVPASRSAWLGAEVGFRFDDLRLTNDDEVIVHGLPVDATGPTAPAWRSAPAAGCAARVIVAERLEPVAVASLRWGPLAVAIEPEVPTGIGTGVGTIAIDDTCVTLEVGGRAETLIWPAERTAYRADTARIVFEDPDRGRVRLKDGDRVSLGGAPLAKGRPSRPGDSGATAPVPTYLVPPDPTCPAAAFVVTEVHPRR